MTIAREQRYLGGGHDLPSGRSGERTGWTSGVYAVLPATREPGKRREGELLGAQTVCSWRRSLQ
jgi:hypothetical protein